MSGIVREHGGIPTVIGGVEDHVYLLIELPATITIAKLLQEVKGSSSRWVNETWPRKGFAWQRGYGAFGVCPSRRADVIRYIENPEARHRRRGFDDELLAMLRTYGLTPDPHDFPM